MRRLQNNTTLDIATAKTSGAFKWRNKVTDWQGVAESLEKTVRTSETLKEYFAFTKDRQDEIKDVGGFVGGKLLGGFVKVKKSGHTVEIAEPYGLRRKGHVAHRQLVALDVDYGDLDVWLDFIGLGVAGLMYTTHKHRRESCRLRIVFPLDRPVTVDEYEAISRQVADWLGIDLFDDTTYQPTRMMYYPSTAYDGEYVFDVTDSPIMCADDVLASMDDSLDPTTWPRSSRENTLRHALSDRKLEDPADKDGIVGHFCRVYGIDEVISEFLFEVYVPTDNEDRYTFAGGSTGGGLVVYGNVHAYSNHATDPAGSKACNAFDLVRLHKFGDMDEAFTGEDITKAPSYKAMVAFASALPEVKKEIVFSRRGNILDYDEIEEHAVDVGMTDDWITRLELDNSGKIKPTIDNVVRILHNDEQVRGLLAFNKFEVREVALRRCPWDKPKEYNKYPRALEDHDDANIRLYIERGYGIKGKEIINDAVLILTRANAYHPVRDYLDSLEWDGVDRLDNLLTHVFGVPSTEYSQLIMRKWATAAVARIYQSGCKFDYMLLIAGEQGRGKSTFFARLGMQWYTDSVDTVEGKEAYESLQGAWIAEMGELAGMSKASVNHQKKFISKQEDRFRVAYGKRIGYFPRSLVFGGTTNEREFFKDFSGNRRYWVADILGHEGDSNVWDYLTPFIVNQIWAEAKFRYEQGESLELPTAVEEVAKGIQGQYLERDERAGMIAEYLQQPLTRDWATKDVFQRRNYLQMGATGDVVRTVVCLLDIWAECLGRNPEDLDRSKSLELGRIMRTVEGWELTGSIRTTHWGTAKCFTLRTPFEQTKGGVWDGKEVIKGRL